MGAGRSRTGAQRIPLRKLRRENGRSLSFWSSAARDAEPLHASTQREQRGMSELRKTTQRACDPPSVETLNVVNRILWERALMNLAKSVQREFDIPCPADWRNRRARAARRQPSRQACPGGYRP